MTGIDHLITLALSINAEGVYVGLTRVPFGQPQGGLFGGFVGRDGWMVPVLYPGYTIARASDINDSNKIVGVHTTPTATRGYIAKAFEDEIYDLGLLDDPTVNGVSPRAINNAGEIVGAATLGGSFRRAVYWPAGATQPIDLNTLVDLPGVTLVEAMDINNAGQILARGTGGYYIFTPVPEPAAAVMAAGAVSVLAGRRGGRGRVCGL